MSKTLLLAITIVFILASAIWTLNYKIHFNGFLWNDTHDYNQIAKNIYNGNGFKTSTLRPISFLKFKQLPHPEIARPPIYPHILAGFFMIFGVNDFSVVLCNGIFYVITVVLTFLVAIKLSNKYKIALFATITVALSKFFLYMSIIGSSDIVYAGIFMFFIFYYLKNQKMMFWHGAILGLMYLLRSNTIFIIIPWLFLEFKLKGFLIRWQDFLKFSIGFIIAVLSFFIRNYIETGDLMFSIHKYALMTETKTFPGWTIWTQLNDMSQFQFAINHYKDVLVKLTFSLSITWKTLFVFFYPSDLFILSSAFILPVSKDDKIKKFRRFILWIIVLQTFLLLPTGGSPARFYLYLFPIVIIFLGMAIQQLLNNIKEKFIKDKFLTIVLVVISILILCRSAGYLLKDSKQINFYSYFGEKLKTITKPADVIASDMSWGISWYADRKSVWLPYDIETMDKISKNIPIDYVFLTQDLVYPLASYKDNIWQRLFFEVGSFNIPKFKLVDVFYYNKNKVGVLYKVIR